MQDVWLVEDDVALGDLTAAYLKKCGYTIRLFRDGHGIVEQAKALQPDVVILDIELPGESGLSICRRLRPQFDGVLVLLTARSEEFDEILGLELGADDYVVKPASPRKLHLRLQALLRRPAQRSTDALYEDDELSISMGQRTVRVHDVPVEITTAELDLLWLLARHVGRPVSREDYFSQVRGIRYDGLDRSMDIYVSQLRRKLEQHGLAPGRLLTVHGVGYQLTRPDAT